MTATSTYGDMQDRVADELARSDLTAQIKKAILSAIDYYENEPFWFLENRATASTVDGQRNYALPSDYLYDDSMKVTINSRFVPMDKRPWDWMEQAYQNTTYKSYPQYWADYQANLWLYPVPNGVYTLTLSYRRRLTELSATSDYNDWTTTAEILVRCRAKADLYRHVLRSYADADRMEREEVKAYRSLMGNSTVRTTAGHTQTYL